MDKFKLEYEMKSKGVSDNDMCTKLGISRSAFYRKKNGLTEFTLGEVTKIVEILKLETPMDIFFANKVS